MERHVHVSDRDGNHLKTYPITLGIEPAERRESEYFERARQLAREDNLVRDEMEAQALRFAFASGRL